jgi:DNA invertase Pin-like site-specific DNA recombinase
VIDGVDTTTDDGELPAHMHAAVAQWYRRRVSRNTKAALARLKREGKHVGRPVGIVGPPLVDIVARFQAGASVSQIARDLTAEHVARPDGTIRPWQPYMVARVLDRAGVRPTPKGAAR